MLFVDIARRTGPVRSKERKTNLDHMGSMQVNELVALVLDRKQREQPRRIVRRPIWIGSSMVACAGERAL